MNFLGSVITFATRFPSWGRRCPGCSEFAANISRGARPHSPNAQSIPGMAAGVTERLWEIGDIVDVLEAWERVRAGDVAWALKFNITLKERSIVSAWPR
jgi:hypothetical protein